MKNERRRNKTDLKVHIIGKYTIREMEVQSEKLNGYFYGQTSS